jgi:3,4-dihydroxy-2-butanone 4-phosphate synthase
MELKKMTEWIKLGEAIAAIRGADFEVEGDLPIRPESLTDDEVTAIVQSVARTACNALMDAAEKRLREIEDAVLLPLDIVGGEVVELDGNEPPAEVEV